MWSTTKLTKLLDIELPILLGPFGGKLSSVTLTSIVSNAGGLGGYGCQPFFKNEIVALAREIRTLTDRPINLNLWVNDKDEASKTFDESAFQQVIELFQPYFEAMGMELPDFPILRIR